LVHPSFLWALLLLAIPVIVHLFNLRKYKKEYFSNTSLLKTILSETQKTSKLKKRLLLASRLLAMFFIIMAFVQPLFNAKQAGTGSGQPIVSIYIDNSFSMESPAGQLKALDDAKQKAVEIIKSTENQGLYQILSNDFNGNQLQLLPYAEAREAIRTIEISSNRKTANEIWEKQIKTTSSNHSERKVFYWLSDFQKNQYNKLNQITDYPLTCIPIIHNEKRNIYIDTAFIYSPAIKANQDIKIIYRIRKSADDKSDKSLVTLTVNDAVKSRNEVVWKDKTTITDTLIVKLVSQDWQFLKLNISDPSVSFDNEYFFSFYLTPKPYITLVSNGADQKFITNALKADDNFDVHGFGSLDLSAEEVKNSNLIVLNQPSQWNNSEKVNEWLKANKHVAIFLPADAILPAYNQGLTAIGVQSLAEWSPTSVRMKQFNLQDPTLQNIFTQIDKLSDLPSFSSYYILSGYSPRAKEVLISFDNGAPFLIKYSRLGEGSIYLFTANISSSKSDFVFSSIFAPLMYKLGSAAASFQLNSYFIGSDNSISIPVESNSKDNVFKITGKDVNVIPPQRKIGNTLQCQLHESIMESGFYSVENSDGVKIYQLALNHKRGESEMEFMDAGEIANALGYKNLEIDSGNSSYLKSLKAISGVNLWKLWVILALLFLLSEMAIILFWDKFYSQYLQTKSS
jgi:hypothetical protein